MASSDLSWLESLNPAQRRAVESPAGGSLQILAGPGSGKTRVLTCRVAYLIKHTGIDPSDLVVVTFTNKAANEMKHRLNDLVGAQVLDQLMIGTFHGVCVKFLRRYGSHVGLKPNWVICDRDQQLAYAKSVLNDPKYSPRNGASNIKVTPKSLVDYVSKRKSKGEDVQPLPNKKIDPFMQDLFKAYGAALKDDNCLDFDDLLGYGEELFRRHPHLISYVKHVLIDEFQDTNVVQYEMMRHLAHRGAVTIVGDPDQGIYGWRSAEVGNLSKMEKEIPNTKMIFLEENYRSSSLILDASLTVVQQDTNRIDKSLFTSHPEVALPVLHSFQKPTDESDFIAQEIQRVIAYTGGQLNYDDFSILLRYNALSRSVEAALQSAGIPSRMVGGQKFFDRAEVKDILAYLQLADNPMFVPAFERIINVPRRAIGLTTVKAVKEAAKVSGLNPMEILIRSVKGTDYPGLGQTHRNKFKTFLAVIYKIQSMAKSGSSIVEIIDTLIEQIGYVDHLQKTHGLDAVHRNQNVQELKSFAIHLEGGDMKSSQAQRLPSPDVEVVYPTTSQQDIDEMMVGMITETTESDEEPTALRRFLTESMLSTDTETEESTAKKNSPKVTISTCHASKGLEWPVVFIPAVEENTFPFYFCREPEQIKEERRLLFVAMTRAQGLLYLTHCKQRMAGAENRNQEISRFVESVSVQDTKSKSKKDAKFTSLVSELDKKQRQELSSIIGRQMASEADVKYLIEVYNQIPRKEFKSNNSKASGSGATYANKSSNYAPSVPTGRFVSSSQPSPRKDITREYGFNRPAAQPPSHKAAPTGSSSQPTPAKPSPIPSTTRKYGYNRPGAQPPPIPVGGFASAYTLHQSQTGAPMAAEPISTSSTKSTTAFIPQIPRQPLTVCNRAVENFPDTRLSQGSRPAFLIGQTSTQVTTTGHMDPSLANLTASSSNFMNDLKRSIPNDVVTKKSNKKTVAKNLAGSTSTVKKPPAKKRKSKKS